VAPSRLAENYQSVEEARALLVAGLKELGSLGEVRVLLEAAPFRLWSSSGEIAGIVDEVALPNVGAALDVAHALLAGEDPQDAAKALGERLRYVQVHDVGLRSGVPALDQHLPFGRGSLKKEEVVGAIGTLPYAVTVAAPEDALGAARGAMEWLR